MSGILYHGGKPGLKPGDLIEPGHSRDQYDDCPICQDGRNHGATAFEGTEHPEQVYCTNIRDYAALHASLYGKGDVYQVKPLGPLTPSDENETATWRCDRLQVIYIVEASVQLDWKRRRIFRKLDRIMPHQSFDSDPIPPATAPMSMIIAWQNRYTQRAIRTMNRLAHHA